MELNLVFSETSNILNMYTMNDELLCMHIFDLRDWRKDSVCINI